MKTASSGDSGDGDNSTNTVKICLISVMTTSVYAFVVIVLSVELSKKGYNTIGDVIGYVSLIS